MLKRWKGPIVSVFIIQEIEFRALMEFILQQTRSILFNIYIIPTYTITPFIYQGKHKYYMPNGIYPFNVLRDIGIESITTTHYLLLDIDVFPSRNLYDDILNNKQILYDYNSVLLLQLFQYAKKKTKGITDMNVFYELWIQRETITIDGMQSPFQRRISSWRWLWRRSIPTFIHSMYSSAVRVM